MKSYNFSNYSIYKEDIYSCGVKTERNKTIKKFLPLVESIARKFNRSQLASGVLNIEDLIQEGSVGLIKAVDKLDFDILAASDDEEKTIKSFLSKRIKGAIRRAIDINRAGIKIPEYRLIELRTDPDNNEKAIEQFFNTIFVDIDSRAGKNQTYTIADVIDIENSYQKLEELGAELEKIIDSILTPKESNVLKMSFGINCKKCSARIIADKIGLTGRTSYVRISEIKREGLRKLKENISYSQIVDFL